MLVELGLVEQRYKAVCEVLDGATVVDVARSNGVARQTVHDWLRAYARSGLAGLADRSSKPQSCPHQMAPEVEARILELRRAHPGWGPRTIGHRLGREGLEPVPGRSSIYRCLVRHGLITPQARRRRRSDYKRWERSKAMELWQMDIVGGVRLVDGSEAKIVTGVDDHSRFCISAYVVARATARPTCDALALAMRTHGVPAQILTDNGKVFTGRFGPGTGEVLFDRICRENGIRHLLTAPRSPTTTGKVERFHRTLRGEFLTGKVFTSIEEAQASLDAWVATYNHDRPHQSIGMVAPFERFRLAAGEGVDVNDRDAEVAAKQASATAAPGATAIAPTRRVGGNGLISRRQLSGRSVAGRRRCQRRLRRRPRAPAPPGGAHCHSRPAPLPRQASGRAAPGEPSSAGAPAPIGLVGVGHPQGGFLGQPLLRRRQLSGRVQVPPPPGAGGGRG